MVLSADCVWSCQLNTLCVWSCPLCEVLSADCEWACGPGRRQLTSLMTGWPSQPTVCVPASHPCVVLSAARVWSCQPAVCGPAGPAAVRCQRRSRQAVRDASELVGRPPRHRRRHHGALLQHVEGVPRESGHDDPRSAMRRAHTWSDVITGRCDHGRV